MATDYEGLVPRAVLDEFLGFITAESAVLRLANVMRMNAGAASMPIVSFLPTAGFVNPRYGGRKPATKIEWSAEQLLAEEVAAVLAVPTAWVEDAGFDVEGQVERALASAIALAIDDAILNGVGAPASFPAGGIVAAAGAAVTGTDAGEAIDAAAAAVEATGIAPDGIASGANIGTALRQLYREAGALPGEVPDQNFYGMPVAISPAWDSADGDALVGDWDYAAVAVREDITFRQTDVGVLQDGTGDIIANLWQDNLTGIKVFMRLGFALGAPLKPDGSGAAQPFAMADWTPVTP